MTETMFCPRCGKQFGSGTSYCRRCGLGLLEVSKIVDGSAASAPAVRTRPNFKAFRLGIGLMIFGLIIGLGNAAVRELGLFPQAYGKLVFFAMIAASMLCFGVMFLFPQKYYAKPKGRPRTDGSNNDLSTDRLNLLPDADRNIDDLTGRGRERDPVSVTEHTTRQL